MSAGIKGGKKKVCGGLGGTRRVPQVDIDWVTDWQPLCVFFVQVHVQYVCARSPRIIGHTDGDSRVSSLCFYPHFLCPPPPPRLELVTSWQIKMLHAPVLGWPQWRVAPWINRKYGAAQTQTPAHGAAFAQWNASDEADKACICYRISRAAVGEVIRWGFPRPSAAFFCLFGVFFLQQLQTLWLCFTFSAPTELYLGTTRWRLFPSDD